MGKIIKLKDYILKKTLEDVMQIIKEAKEYDIKVELTKKELKTIIKEFYKYYEKKKIVFAFQDSMIKDFNNIVDNVVDYEKVDLFYVLDKLNYYELIESRLEIKPKETSKVLKRIYAKCMRRWL